MAKNSIKKKVKLSEPVSIVAHQLKNPISALNGYLEVLISEEIGELNKKQKEYLIDARENVNNMKSTVKDLLDVSRIEGGRYTMDFEPLDLMHILKETVKEFGPWAKAANCKIIPKEKKEEFRVSADPTKIKYVIKNFISNAIKYKSMGPGIIEVELEKIKKEVVFSCKDNGIGIAKKDFGKVFSKFFRAEDAISLDPSGTGLGLYISRAIVELSGGKIWFEKNKEKGMTFYFSLPILKNGQKRK